MAIQLSAFGLIFSPLAIAINASSKPRNCLNYKKYVRFHIDLAPDINMEPDIYRSTDSLEDVVVW